MSIYEYCHLYCGERRRCAALRRNGGGHDSRLPAQPGFERLIVARAVDAPLTFVTMSWWESEDALRAWTTHSAYRQAKDRLGGEGPEKPRWNVGRWLPADQK